MNRDDIIRMAREANILEPIDLLESNPWRQDTIRELERFAELVAAAQRNRTWTQSHWTEYERSIAAAEREACVKECKKLFKVFLSSEYATGQPLSSFKERHAVAACIESIEARGTHETN